MKNLKQLERLRRTHRLIQEEKTGSPKDLAKRLHISERQVYLIMEQLRELDAPVRFCRHSKTYYYEDAYDLMINVSIQVIAGDQLLNIYAGRRFADFVNSLQGSCSVPVYLSYVKTKLDVVG
jgi:hypothetical protein